MKKIKKLAGVVLLTTLLAGGLSSCGVLDGLLVPGSSSSSSIVRPSTSSSTVKPSTSSSTSSSTVKPSTSSSTSSSSSTVTNKTEQEMIYDLAVNSGYKKSYDEWLVEVHGESIELSLRVEGICWKYSNDTNWNLLIQVNDMKGVVGDDGRKVEFNVSPTHIQIRYEGEKEYRDLIALDLLTVEGNKGQSAYEAAVELGFVGDEYSWLESLKGQDGNNGKSAYEIYIEYNPSYTGNEAQWIEDLANGLLSENYYTVSFDTGCYVEIEDQLVRHGQKVQEPEIDLTDVNYGYTFSHWEIDDEEWNFMGYPVTESMTLKAVWDPIVLTITLVYGNEKVEYFVDYGEAFTFPEPKEQEGMVFDGWLNPESNSLLPVDSIFPYKDAEFIAQYKLPYDYEEVMTGFIKLTKYLGDEKDVFVPAYIDGKLVMEIGSTCFAENDTIELVVIESLSSFNQYAFKNCTNLKSVTIPGSVTGIPEGLFYGCTNLQEINMSPNDFMYIDNLAFAYCTSLEYFILRENMKIGMNVFEGCKGLKYISLQSSGSYYPNATFNDLENTVIFIKDSEYMYSSLEDYEVIKAKGIFNFNVTSIEFVDNDACSYTLLNGYQVFDYKSKVDDKEYYAFEDIPNNYQVIGLSEDAFKDHKKLKGLTFIYGKYIFDNAFNGCENFEYIINDYVYVTKDAFANTNVIDVYISGAGYGYLSLLGQVEEISKTFKYHMGGSWNYDENGIPKSNS